MTNDDTEYIMGVKAASRDEPISFHHSYLLGKGDESETDATERSSQEISEYLATIEPRKRSKGSPLTLSSSFKESGETDSESGDSAELEKPEPPVSPRKRASMKLSLSKNPTSNNNSKASETTDLSKGNSVLTNLNERQVDPRKVYKIPLIPINCSFGIVTEKRHEMMKFQSMVKKEKSKLSRDAVTVVFAVRRPGCGACREHALQLRELAQQENFGCVGVIKHINVDNDALLEFYQEYFKCPIYVDEKWQTYKALGDRKIKLWKLIPKGIAMELRYKKKGIRNVPFGGDIFTQGGILVFDKDANLRYVYYETYGEVLDLDVLRKAIQDAREPLPPKST